MKQSLALLLVSRKKRTHSDLLAKPGDLARMSCASGFCIRSCVGGRADAPSAGLRAWAALLKP